MNLAERPVLVFWETTRACHLSCIHCRASAVTDPLPGELTTREGFRLIDSVTAFGEPYPTLIVTGGDPLRRGDVFPLLEHAREAGVRTALSPAVTDLLTDDALRRAKEAGVSSISISLDGSHAGMHDKIRRRPGTFAKTVAAIRRAGELGLNVQVNTAVMKLNMMDMAEIFRVVRELGVKVWEVFFVVRVGRGAGVRDLSAGDCESVCNFLYDASRYGVLLRTVEAPFIRRVARLRAEDYWQDESYLRLRESLLRSQGPPSAPSSLAPRGTLDGDGIVFVGYDGSVYPGGLLPLEVGNVRKERIADVYRRNETLNRIRERRFLGYCGSCDYRWACGGSRARAYSGSGDPFGSDPACIEVARPARV